MAMTAAGAFSSRLWAAGAAEPPASASVLLLVLVCRRQQTISIPTKIHPPPTDPTAMPTFCARSMPFGPLFGGVLLAVVGDVVDVSGGGAEDAPESGEVNSVAVLVRVAFDDDVEEMLLRYTI